MTPLMLQFLFGTLILVFCARLFIHLAEKISHAFRISPLLIGATLVAVGTSLPELSVSTLAAATGDIGLAVGNLVGSNIINILLVAGIGVLLGKLRIGWHKTQQEAMLLLAVTILFALLHLTGIQHTLMGIILLVLAGVVTLYQYYLNQHKSKEDIRMFFGKKRPHFKTYDAILIPAAIGGLAWGATMTVSSLEAIAQITGYSTTLLGLTVAAAATSLPELITTIISEEEHEVKLTVGNILGSNYYNILLIGGIVSLLQPDSVIGTLDWITLLVSTIFFVVILHIYKGRIVPRWIAGIMFLLFGAYLFARIQ